MSAAPPGSLPPHQAALNAAFARADLPALRRAARQTLALAAGPAPAGPPAAQSALLAHAARLLALLGAPAEALPCLRAAQQTLPQSAVLASNAVHYLLAAGRVGEAEAEARALAADATPPAEVASVGALVARANTRGLLGRADARADAAEVMRRVIAGVRELGAMRGLLDEVARGVTPRSDLERLLAHGRVAVALERRAPAWAGEPCAGRRFLARASGGLGDQIQSVRLARRLADAGGHVTLLCDPALHALALAAGAAHAVADGRPLDAGAPPPEGPFDYTVALTLDADAGTAADGADLPPDVPRGYLAPADGALPHDGLPHDPAGGPGLRVGLVWAGSPAHPQDRVRSMPAAALKRLVAAAPAVAWVSLQLGPRAAELRATPATRRVRELGSTVASLLDTAHLMRALDLVVSVDSAPAHLAGALGVPVWTLLGPLADWRWQLRRSDTPLYPSMTLVRDAATGAWDAAVDRVAAELRARAAEAAGAAGRR